MPKPPSEPHSDKSLYLLTHSLDGLQGPASCIRANADGTFVACGSETGTVLWKLPSGQKVQVPTNASDRGATTALVWITRPDDPEEALAYGTAEGYFCVWKRSENDAFVEVASELLESNGAKATEISALAYDSTSSQIAAANRAGVIHRIFIDGRFNAIPLEPSVTISSHCPSAIAFGLTSTKGPEIWSFGREDGIIYVIDGDRKVVDHKSTGTVVGDAVLSLVDDIIALDDVAQGVALYKLSSRERLKTLDIPSTARRSRNVALHDHQSAIVSGSDHGGVYIFERRTGEIRDILRTGNDDWVQCVATIEREQSPQIVIGRSGLNAEINALQVWTKAGQDNRVQGERKTATVLETGRWIICVVLALMFVLQNVLNLPIMSKFYEALTYLQ